VSTNRVQFNEAVRQKVVSDLFRMSKFAKAWPVWAPDMNARYEGPYPSAADVLELGNHVRDVFLGTSLGERSQSALSSGGSNWEGLVCWYLNLCLLDTRCVVIKKTSLIPTPIRDALTVMYGSVPSNTESDLVAITFPEETLNETLPKNLRGYGKIADQICTEYFDQIEVCVIQCKTNWNDAAQKPMLWDIIYSSAGFASVASVGRNCWSVKSLKKFAYAFATVPTNKTEYKSNITPMLRVKALSGGNYWGKPTEVDVAMNISEILNKNFLTAITSGEKYWHAQQNENYAKLSIDHP